MLTKISNAFFKHDSSTIIKLFLLLALTLPISTLAADEEKPQSETNSSEDSKVLSPEKKTEPKKQSSKTKKVSGFKPSEEISEDYSVPFPVDI